MKTVPFAATAFLFAANASASAQDTTRVKANSAPEWGPDAKLVRRLALGELDGPTEYSFGRIVRAAAADDGSFYLYDDNDVQIRRYSSQGVFERKIGRKGGGPGEYQGVSGLQVTRDGHLVVFDRSSARITYFDADGTVRREISNLRSSDAGGFFVDLSGVHYLTVRLPGPLEGPHARHQYVRLTQAGTIVDSIRHPADTKVPRTGFCHVTAEGMRCNFLEETLVVAYLPGGMLTGHAKRYAFSVIRPGRPVLKVERSQKAIALTGPERDEWVARAADMKSHSLAGSVFEVPRVKPAIRGLMSDDSGRIWVDVYVAAEKHHPIGLRHRADRLPFTWRERTTYDVFSAEGRYLGRLQLPWESKVLTVRGDRVYVLRRGSEGEEHVDVYEISRAN